MQIPKSSDADRERFRAIVPVDPQVEIRPMFGNLGAFVNGNMFIGLYGSSIGLKLASADAAELMKMGGAGPFLSAERPMAGWVSLPEAMIGTADGGRWIRRALDYVASAPAKGRR